MVSDNWSLRGKKNKIKIYDSKGKVSYVYNYSDERIETLRQKLIEDTTEAFKPMPLLARMEIEIINKRFGVE